jgi:hypothetical protein
MLVVVVVCGSLSESLTQNKLHPITLIVSRGVSQWRTMALQQVVMIACMPCVQAVCADVVYE